jgi:EmrB/QacA subfamily drug resistance transporter
MSGTVSTVSAASLIEAPRLPMSRRRRLAVIGGLMVGMFIAALEATVVGTAMPTVIASLGGLEWYSWVFSGYLLTSTVTVPVWGKLSDLYGRRPVYLLGIAIFLLGSALSGLSVSMTQLIVFRALQGLGAGALVPIAMTIIGEIFTTTERTRMQGVFSGVWGVASIIGPLAGGFITDQLSWRWVFFINLPVGAVAMAIIGAALAEPRRDTNPSIDYAGATTLMLAITLLLLGLFEAGQPSGWTSPSTLVTLLSSTLLFALFIRVERRAVEPVVPFELLRVRTVASSLATGFLVGVSMFGALSFVPLFAQGVLGQTATEAGKTMMPLLMAWVVMAIVGGRLLLWAGVRTLVLCGTMLLTASFALLATFSPLTPRPYVMAVIALIGSGLGLTVLALMLAGQAGVAREQLGIATSLNLFSRAIGGAIGVAIMGTVLTRGFMARLAELGVAATTDPNGMLNPVARDSIAPESLAAMQVALAGGLRGVFVIAAVMAALALVSAVWLPKRLA